MPFRQNFFGDRIPQPGTEWAEIEEMLSDRLSIADATPVNAELFTLSNDDAENLFGFGGSLLVTGTNLDAEEGEDDFAEANIEFDGFDSLDDARMWLIGLGIKDYDIEEVR